MGRLLKQKKSSAAMRLWRSTRKQRPLKSQRSFGNSTPMFWDPRTKVEEKFANCSTKRNVAQEWNKPTDGAEFAGVGQLLQFGSIPCQHVTGATTGTCG